MGDRTPARIATLLALCLFAPAAGGQVRLHTDLVTCDVVVQDANGRNVAGLERSQFAVSEDGVKQDVAFFGAVDEPLTIGIVMDVSRSMETRFSFAIESLKAFVETCHPEDEFFVISFSDRPRLLRDFTRDAATVFNTLTLEAPKGDTTLVDAAVLGLEKAQGGSYRKRALVIISDGEDNTSRYSLSDLQESAREADVLIYSVAFVDVYRRDPFTGKVDPTARLSSGRNILKKISEASGGRAYFPEEINELHDACTEIALELRSQYRIGYYPSNPKPDNHFRKIKVDVTADQSKQRLRVRAREGYYLRNGSPADRISR